MYKHCKMSSYLFHSTSLRGNLPSRPPFPASRRLFVSLFYPLTVAVHTILKISYVHVGSAVHALRTCLFTDTHLLTHSYMPDDIVGRDSALHKKTHQSLFTVFTANNISASLTNQITIYLTLMLTFVQVLPRTTMGILNQNS